MICEACKNKNATVHYRYNENGNITERHLCADCAEKEGLMNSNLSVTDDFVYDMFGDTIGKFSFIPFMNQGSNIKGRSTNQRVCPGCGLTENELRTGGKLGCEKCYSVFSDYLNIVLNKMHLSTEYKGKIPESAERELSLVRKIENLKADMYSAVEAQRYEEAAKIRDKIKQLEEGLKNIKDSDGGAKN